MSAPVEPPETNPAFIAKEEDFTKLPSELSHVDWTKPIAWGKHEPYPPSSGNYADPINTATDADGDKQAAAATAVAPPLPLTPEGTAPSFKPPHQALEFHVHATSGRARYTTVHLPHGPVATPVFMPVGTKGTLKGLSPMDITNSMH